MDPEKTATEVKPSKKRKKSASAGTPQRRKAAKKARETFLRNRGVPLNEAGTEALVRKAREKKGIAGAESAREAAIAARDVSAARCAAAESAAANALAQAAAEAAARADMEQVPSIAVQRMYVAEEKLLKETQRREAEIKLREAEDREISLRAELEILKGKEVVYVEKKSVLLGQSRLGHSQQQQPLIAPEDEGLYSLDEVVQLQRYRVKRLEKDVQHLELMNRDLHRRREALRQKVSRVEQFKEKFPAERRETQELLIKREEMSPEWSINSPSPGSLGLFDQISPKNLAELAKSHKYLSGELLEIKLGDVRLICRPVDVETDDKDPLRTITFYNLVFAVVSEYRLPRRLYPSGPLPDKSLLVKTPSTPTATAAASNAPGDGALEKSPLGFSRDLQGAKGGVENGRELDAEGGDFGERGPGVDLSLLRGALMMTSRGLYHEEVLNGFISESSKLLLRKQEEWGQIVSPNAGAPWSSHHHSFARSDSHQRSCERMGSRKGFSIFGGRVPQSSALTRSELYWRQVVVEDCQLAQDIETLFNGLTSGAPFEMTINRWSALSINVSVQRPISDAKRYETLILREDEHIILAELPRDSSPQLRQLIEMADPRMTLDEISFKLEIELSQIFRLARHMEFWGEGRVVDTLSKTNRYRASRAARQASLASSPVTAEFAAKFPKRSLVEEIARFGQNRPLSEIMERTRKSQRGMLIPVLTFLLRRDLLVQMQRYVVLQIPAPPEIPCPGSITSATDAIAAAGAAARRAEVFDRRRPRGQEAEDGQTEGGIGNLRTVFGGSASGPDVRHVDGSYDTSSSSGLHLTGGWGNLVSRPGGDGGGVVGVGGTGTRSDTATTTLSGSWGKFPGSFADSSTEYRDKKSLFEPPTLEPYEDEYLRARDDGSETSELMRRLAPFFRGKLHLREIVWRLDIDDMQGVEQVLKCYADVLVERWQPARDPTPEYHEL